MEVMNVDYDKPFGIVSYGRTPLYIVGCLPLAKEAIASLILQEKTQDEALDFYIECKKRLNSDLSPREQHYLHSTIAVLVKTHGGDTFLQKADSI